MRERVLLETAPEESREIELMGFSMSFGSSETISCALENTDRSTFFFGVISSLDRPL